MARPASEQPTESELRLLHLLWELGPSRARVLFRRIELESGTTYSTTVKTLSIMLDKGLVKRDENERPHVYRATQSKRQTGKNLIGSLAKRMFDGSSLTLAMQALSTGRATSEEIEKMRELLEKMEKKNE